MTRLSRYKPPDHNDDYPDDASDGPEPYANVDLSEQEKEQILAYLRNPELHPEEMVMEAVLWFDRGVFDDYPDDIIELVIDAIREFKFLEIADELVKNGERMLMSVPRRPSPQ